MNLTALLTGAPAATQTSDGTPAPALPGGDPKVAFDALLAGITDAQPAAAPSLAPVTAATVPGAAIVSAVATPEIVSVPVQPTGTPLAATPATAFPIQALAKGEAPTLPLAGAATAAKTQTTAPKPLPVVDPIVSAAKVETSLPITPAAATVQPPLAQVSQQPLPLASAPARDPAAPASVSIPSAEPVLPTAVKATVATTIIAADGEAEPVEVAAAPHTPEQKGKLAQEAPASKPEVTLAPRTRSTSKAKDAEASAEPEAPAENGDETDTAADQPVRAELPAIPITAAPYLSLVPPPTEPAPPRAPLVLRSLAESAAPIAPAPDCGARIASPVLTGQVAPPGNDFANALRPAAPVATQADAGGDPATAPASVTQPPVSQPQGASAEAAPSEPREVAIAREIGELMARMGEARPAVTLPAPVSPSSDAAPEASPQQTSPAQASAQQMAAPALATQPAVQPTIGAPASTQSADDGAQPLQQQPAPAAPQPVAAGAATPTFAQQQFAFSLPGDAAAMPADAARASQPVVSGPAPVLPTAPAPVGTASAPSAAVPAEAPRREDKATAAVTATAPMTAPAQPFAVPPQPAPVDTSAPAVQPPVVADATAPAEQQLTRQLDLARDAAWLDGLARDIAQSAGSDAKMRFQLNPEHLGSLHVELTRGADGTAVRLTADSEQARAILADAQPRLLAEARAQGMRISDAQVDVTPRAAEAASRDALPGGNADQGRGNGSQQAAGQGAGQQRQQQAPVDNWVRVRQQIAAATVDAGEASRDLYA